MFLGHYAVALGAKRVAPETSLGTLVLAAQLADLVWPILVLAGVERVRVEPGITAFSPLDFEHYPLTHSAALVLVWAALLAGIYLARTGYRAGAIACGVAVASHWVLDLVVHRPDLPIWPGGPKVGLGVWRSVPATLAVELLLFAAGVAIYLSSTRARDRAGTIGIGSLLAFLLIVYAASALGPPPPSSQAIGGAGLALWLLVPWAAWADRHRAPRGAARGPSAALQP
ncbi:hypothetical protein [Anaeromyxobacter oryzae]|uniref:Membrane-bound metal-dependent hydrolase n=1 Tax=Anaeromyxobacter oryzae TaxID=2918170 RepID=A0ABM7WRK8_9BACT|nr:hypothetical protein [Anaeromyxobacter oryzae]BDG02105.1 hypothetical protein AMOR_11010 [Anaeromyxobacter oryzae]